MPDARPVIAILTQITDASFGVWNQPAVVLPAGYVTEVQRAGGIALVLTPDGYLVDHPDELLDRVDGLVLSGGGDIDPAAYGARAPPGDVTGDPGARRVRAGADPPRGRARPAGAGDLPRHPGPQRRVRRHAAAAPARARRPRRAPPHRRQLRRQRPRRPADRRIAGRARRRRAASTAPSHTTTRASTRSATGWSRPGSRRSTSSSRRSSCPTGGSCSGSSGTPRPTSAAASSGRSCARPSRPARERALAAGRMTDGRPLRGRTALVTGASRGIGAATAVGAGRRRRAGGAGRA